jgi:hypothetical protein
MLVCFLREVETGSLEGVLAKVFQFACKRLHTANAWSLQEVAQNLPMGHFSLLLGHLYQTECH